MSAVKNCLCFLFATFTTTLSLADDYPKNARIDVKNYAFRIELSDTTDEIKCEVIVDVRYPGEGVEFLRLDLIKASPALGNRGMRISKIFSEGNALSYTHENDELKIQLPTSSKINQLSKYIITYSGIPATGLKIANNKYDERTFFSDNWPNKGRNWLAMVDHPYDKATCEFIVTAPSHYQVVSNGLKVDRKSVV